MRIDGTETSDATATPDGTETSGGTETTDGIEAPDGTQTPDAVHRALERPGGTAGHAGAMPTDPEWRATVHRLYRVLVDHVYGLAHDTWVQAVPDLRTTWEKIEEKYPGHARATPRTQADGAWVADGNRRLAPDQNAEATAACAGIRDQGERVILPAMERIEAADPSRRLAGLEHRLKGEDRLKEKVADQMTAKPLLTITRAVDTVSDPVRFTFVYSPQRYAEGTLSDVERLKSEGFELIKLKNLWSDDQYKGINSQWRSPEIGVRFEVQFHTLESMEAKELTHKAYERIRSSASPAERQELKTFQHQVNALMITPAGTTEIQNFPEKR